MCLMPILSAGHPDRIISDILEKERRLRRDYGRGYKKFGCETVQFQWFLKEELVKASARAGLYSAVEEVHTADKTLRIQTMQPDIMNKYIKFNRRHAARWSSWHSSQWEPMMIGSDALEGCRTLATRKSESLRSSQGKA
ncbi:MAG: hypothetical protein ACLTW9_04240 [Enterocloster sp.]